MIIDRNNDGIPICFKCTLCDYVSAKWWHLILHIRNHTNEKPYVCDLANCGKSFTRPNVFQAHKKRHGGSKPHACPVCDKSLYGRSDMLQHIIIHDEARQTRERYLLVDSQQLSLKNVKWGNI